MKKIKSFIKSFDIYGKEIIFNMNGKETINSLSGGICSIIYLLLFFIIFILNIIGFLFAKTPIILSSSEYRNTEDTYDNITNDELKIANFMMNFSTKPPHPIPFYPSNHLQKSILLEYKNNNESVIIQDIGNFTKCEDSELYMKDEKFLDPYKIAMMKSKIYYNISQIFSTCFHTNPNKSMIMLGGNSETKNKSYINVITLEYNMCEYLQRDEKCNITIDEKKKIFNDTRFILLIKNNYPDFQNDPGITEFFEGYNFPIEIDEDLNIEITLKRIRYSTDKNLIYNFFPNIEEQNYITSVDKYYSDSKKRNTISINYFINLSGYIDKIERSYLKLDGLLANIGSIIVIIEYFTRFIADFTSKGNLEHSIYKEIFHIQKINNKSNFLQVDYTKFKSKEKNYRLDIINHEKNNLRDPINNSNDLSKQDIYRSNLNQLNNNNENNKNNSSIIKIIKNDDRGLDVIGDDNIDGKSSQDSKNICINSKRESEKENYLSNYNKGNSIQNSKNIEIELNSLFKDLNKKRLKNKTNYKDINKIESNDIINNDGNLILNKNIDNQTYNRFRDLLKEKTIKKSILVRFYQIFLPCLIKRNKNLYYLIQLEDFINQELDIVKILKKLIEYENLKSIIMTDKQKKIFNIMQKRIINENILIEGAEDYYKNFYFSNKMKEVKLFKYLVDHLFDYKDENKYSKIIMEQLKNSYSL